MTVNHPKSKNVESIQSTQFDRQTPSEAVSAALSTSPLPGEAVLTIPSTSPLPRSTSIPPSQPSPIQITTSRQQKALRYLQRKHIRQERTTTQTQATKTNGTGTALQAPTIALNPQTRADSTAPLQSRNYLQLVNSIAPPLPTTRRSTNLLTVTTVKGERAQRHRKALQRHIARKYLRRSRLDKKRSFQRFWIGLLSMITTLVVIFLTVTSASTYIGYRFYTSTQDQYTSQVLTLRSLMPRDNLKMFDTNGLPIGQLTDQGIHTSAKYDQISPQLINATISTEDKDFWTNPGIDIQRIVKAALQNLEYGRIVQGGSTITQQLIKNLVLHNPTQDIIRKLQEIALTPQINRHYSKQDILEMYLNSVYYGEQAYGVNAAATIYFGLEDLPGKSAASQLDLAQAAMLAGLPSAPNEYNPWTHFDVSINRMTTVLNLMHRKGYITADQQQAALNEAQSPGFLKRPASLKMRAPHFFEFALEQLQKQFHMTRKELSLSDMRVYTTLDVELQDKILQIAQAQIVRLKDRNVTNAAEVLIDHHTGAIRTLLGNIHPDTDNFNVATQGYRQPGSSFKPYVYATAFKQGISPGQAIEDAPISIPQPGRPFTPRNYSGQFQGHMTLRCALQNSLNIPAVKVIEHVGVQATAKTAQDMGITDYKGDLNYAIALGSLNIHLIDHTSAMGTFANSGVHVPYYAIEKVEFANIHQVFEPPQNPEKRVISPQLAYMMTDVLSDNNARTPEFGYCNPLNLRTDGTCYGPILPSAAKTGTTNDFRDTWTVGYTSDYVLGVWVGNNDNSPMIDINGITGAAPIWHDAMLFAEAGRSPKPFINPGGLVKVEQHYSNGVKTNDWYLAGQVPITVFGNKDSSTPTPKPGDKDSSTPTSKPGSKDRQPPTVRPYCSCYSFDFQPPASSKRPTNGLNPPGQDWW